MHSKNGQILMNEFLLYVKNVGIATARLPKAVFGFYKYSPDDGYVKNVMVTLDCLVNTLCLGDPDETISSRSSKAMAYEQSTTPPTWSWGCRMCSFLAIFQENHCAKALERNKGARAVNPDA